MTGCWRRPISVVLTVRVAQRCDPERNRREGFNRAIRRARGNCHHYRQQLLGDALLPAAAPPC